MRLLNLPLNKQTNQKEQKVNIVNRSWRKPGKVMCHAAGRGVSPPPKLNYRWPSQHLQSPAPPPGEEAEVGSTQGAGLRPRCGGVCPDGGQSLWAQRGLPSSGRPRLPAWTPRPGPPPGPLPRCFPPRSPGPDARPSSFHGPVPSHTLLFAPTRLNFLTRLLRTPPSASHPGALHFDTGVDQTKVIPTTDLLTTLAHYLPASFLRPGASPAARSDPVLTSSTYSSAPATASLGPCHPAQVAMLREAWTFPENSLVISFNKCLLPNR